MRDKILILGAGPGQVPIIKAAKKLGYYTIAASIKGDYPGFDIVDEIAYINIFDTDQIVSFAKKAGVKGVISDQSDMAAPLVAKVAEKLGLPTWGYETALKFTDKDKMRAVYEELGLPVPKYRHVTIIDEAYAFASECDYPLIIKPVDSFASRGVFKIYNEEDLIRFFPQSLEASRSGNLLIEELIEGDQYFCQGFVENYKLRLYAFSDRYYYDLPGVAIPYTNAFPAKITDEFRDRISDIFAKVVNHLHPRFGHVWAEWIYDGKRDSLYIIEMAIRGGGAHVTDTLIPEAYGIDSQPFLVRAAMNDTSKSFFDEIISQSSAAFYSFLLPEGKIVRIDGVNEISEIPGVIKTEIKPIRIGDEVPPIVNKDSRYGMVVIKGSDRNALEHTLSNVKARLKIEVETIEGIKGIIWE